MATTAKNDFRPNLGLVPGAAHLALDVVDRTQSTAIALLQDARGEIRAIVDGGIELAEKTATSVFRFAKKLTARVDEGVAETLTGAEHLIGGAVKTVRDTAKAAGSTASTAVAGIAGPSAAA